MAGVAMRPLAMRPLASAMISSAAAGKSSATAMRRTFASAAIQAHKKSAQQTRIPTSALQRTFRRGYADGKGYVEDTAPVANAPKPKKKRAGFFRWTWRLLYVSAIAGFGYSAYGIYVNRHPVDQKEPDPSKKTLVVLGELFPLLCWFARLGETGRAQSLAERRMGCGR